MFHFLGFLFIIIIAILLIGLSIIGTVIRSVFGLGGRRSSSTYRNDRQQSGPSPNEEPDARTKEAPTYNRHKKLFSQDEGEYVDFEEIKEE